MTEMLDFAFDTPESCEGPQHTCSSGEAYVESKLLEPENDLVFRVLRYTSDGKKILGCCRIPEYIDISPYMSKMELLFNEMKIILVSFRS